MAANDTIVMTPLTADAGNVLAMSRVSEDDLDRTKVVHIAGGPHTGITINRATGEKPREYAADAARSFVAHLSSSHGDVIKEHRELRFWFEAGSTAMVQAELSDQFLTELLNPDTFPKDYTKFVIRVLHMLRSYPSITYLELDMRSATSADESHSEYHVHVRAGVVRVTSHVGQKTRTVTSRSRQQQHVDPALQGAAFASISSSHMSTYTRQEERMEHTTSGMHAVTTETHRSVPHHPADPTASRIAREAVAAPVQNGSNQAKVNGTNDVTQRTQVSLAERRGLPTPSSQLSAASSQDDMLAEQMSFGGSTDILNRRESVMFEPPTPMGPILSNNTKLSPEQLEVILTARRNKLLNVLEEAYPNILTTEDCMRITGFHTEDSGYAKDLLNGLREARLIQEVDQGKWMRYQAEMDSTKKEIEIVESDITDRKRKHDIQYVAHVPHLSAKEQPVIAIVTLLYVEKVAVDDMMDDKVTYLTHKKEGEGTVYTIGLIGGHRVVCTKLSRIGHGTNAKLAAGNTVTRLLGTFGYIEHVLLVGVGGAVPHYEDDAKHVRLGDVVMSKVAKKREPVYVYCSNINENQTGRKRFSVNSWVSSDNVLQQLTDKVKLERWITYVEEIADSTESARARFAKPDEDTLTRVVDGRKREVPHPEPGPDSPRALYPHRPVVHYGVIGSGKMFSKNAEARESFAQEHGIRALDSGFQAVMESVEGNRKDSFCVIRGCADYTDGTRSKLWQAYGALTAAAYARALLESLPGGEPEPEDD